MQRKATQWKSWFLRPMNQIELEIAAFPIVQARRDPRPGGRLPKDEAGSFIAEKEKSDVVHDLLANLAENML